jgi:probable aminopeptidase NPEPL1
MCGMKHDMGGAAYTVLNLVLPSRHSKYWFSRSSPHNVHALRCLAENAIGPNAILNNGILFMYFGKTVEINNTNAEGRLVLADGVSYASKHLNPDILIDMATLTGAQLISTGVIIQTRGGADGLCGLGQP